MSGAAMHPVLIMAGGTGGHVMPGLAVASALQARGQSVHWLGAQGGMEERLVQERGLPFTGLRVAGVRGKRWRHQLNALWQLLQSVFAARALLQRLQPRCVLSFGGFASGPGGLAAALARVPLIVHEQNSVAGLTNRVLARFAQRVLCAFAGVLPRAEAVGNPVRAEIEALATQAERAAGPLRILVLGGSQGARALNELVPKALALLPAPQRPAVVHQCGRVALESTQASYAAADVAAQIEPFITDMAQAYANCDLLICRAGALTVAEICAAARSAIFIPFPQAVDDHQTRNARWLLERGSGALLPQSEATPERLCQLLQGYLQDPAQARRDGLRNLALHHPKAAERIAEAALQTGSAAQSIRTGQ